MIIIIIIIKQLDQLSREDGTFLLILLQLILLNRRCWIRTAFAW